MADVMNGDTDTRSPRDQSDPRKELWLRREIANVLVYTKNSGELMYEILSVLVRGFGASGGAIYFMENEGRSITIKATYGLGHKYSDRYQHISSGNNLTGLVAQTGDGIIIFDSRSDPRVTPDVVRMLNYRSAIISPITSKDEVIGIVALIRDDPHFFNDNDLKLLEMISLHVSLLIVTSILQEELGRERSRMDDIMDRVEEGIFEAHLGTGIPVGTDISHASLRILEDSVLVLMNSGFSRHSGAGIAPGAKLAEAFDRKQILPVIKMALEMGEGNGIERRWSGENERVFEKLMLPVIENDMILGVKGIRHDVTSRALSQRTILLQKERTELFLDMLLNDISAINGRLVRFLEKVSDATDIDEVKGEYLIGALDTIKSSSEMAMKIKAMSRIQEGMPSLRGMDLKEVLDTVRDRVMMEGANHGFSISISAPPGPLGVRLDDLASEMFRYIVGFGSTVPGNDVGVEVKPWVYDGVSGFLVTADVREGSIPADVRADLAESWKGHVASVGDQFSALALAGNIVQRYSGRIWIEDLAQPGGVKGTRFMVFLPRE